MTDAVTTYSETLQTPDMEPMPIKEQNAETAGAYEDSDLPEHMEAHEDGSVTYTFEDGRIEHHCTDGSGEVHHPEGGKEFWQADGTGGWDDGHGNSGAWDAEGNGHWQDAEGGSGEWAADGAGKWQDAEGNRGKFLADGAFTNHYVDGSVETFTPDGHYKLRDSEGNVLEEGKIDPETFDDESTLKDEQDDLAHEGEQPTHVALNEDGSITLKFEEGRVEHHYVDGAGEALSHQWRDIDDDNTRHPAVQHDAPVQGGCIELLGHTGTHAAAMYAWFS